MCGIAGQLNLTGEPVLEAPLVNMRDAMAHRGPDDSGIWIDGNIGLAHRRLSIIDLSGGHQPMSNGDRSVWIIYNGEIYNFKELRKELESTGYSFRTQSDTEVIIAAYEVWGLDSVKRLNGIFGFAIWDKNREQLLLARDHAGIKPMYYSLDSERLLFASEIKGIVQNPTLDKTVDQQSVAQYFSYGYIPGPNSIFEHVKKLPPAHFLVCKKGHVSIERYWRYTPSTNGHRRSADDWLDELRDVLRRAVSRQMISDVPLGAFLSGGIDSSLIIRMMAESSTNPVKTFTIGFGEDATSEARYARVVAEKFHTDHAEHEVAPDAMGILPSLVWHLDEPFADSSMLPTYYVSKITRQNVTVALSGDGGDELFAGYTRYQGERVSQSFQRLPAWVRSGIVSALDSSPAKKNAKLRHLGSVLSNAQLDFVSRYRNKESMCDRQTRDALFSSDFKKMINGADRDHAFLEIDEAVAGANFIDRLTLFDLEFYLPNDMLMKVDKMSMASSLEVRVPFLDKEVMEAAARVPAHLKLHGMTTKYLLRKLTSEVLPSEIWGRQKQGFGIPIQKWFRGKLMTFAKDVLLDPRTNARGYLDQQAVERVLSDHVAGRSDKGHLIFALVCFELWNRSYVDGAGATS